MHIGWLDIGFNTILSSILIIFVLFRLFRVLKTIFSSNPQVKKYDTPYEVITFVVIALLVALPVYNEIKIQYTNKEATKVTRLVTGNQQSYARCQREVFDMFNYNNISTSGWVYAEKNSGKLAVKTNLNPKICQLFISWINSDKTNASRNQILALHVVIHEAVHAKGIPNETLTEYEAIKAHASIAKRLGASEIEAQRMFHILKTDINQSNSPPYKLDFDKMYEEEINREKAQNESTNNE